MNRHRKLSNGRMYRLLVAHHPRIGLPEERMRFATPLCLSMVLLGNVTAGQQVLPDLDRADKETVRLRPSALEYLPTPIQQELARRDCTIPQVYPGRDTSNVLRGRFTTSDQTDLAVLCSRTRVSSILVFRGGSALLVSELASAPDRSFLQDMGDGLLRFSRALGVATPQYILDHCRAFGGREPPPLDHDGIADAFVGKASVVWYWFDGQWLQLMGAD